MTNDPFVFILLVSALPFCVAVWAVVHVWREDHGKKRHHAAE